MKFFTRKPLHLAKYKRCATDILARKKIKLTPKLLTLVFASYYIYVKKMGKLASQEALSDKKRIISKQNIITSYKTIISATKVRKYQRTLDEMLGTKNKSTR